MALTAALKIISLYLLNCEEPDKRENNLFSRKISPTCKDQQ